MAWILAAFAAGFLIVWQPTISAALIVIVALIICSFIAPHAAFTLLLTLAPLRTLIETESALRLPLDIGQLMVIWVGGAWVIHQIARRKPILPLTPSPIFALLGVFLLTAALSMFQAESFMAWFNEWLKWIIAGLMAAWVLKLQKPEWFVFGLVLAGLANALIGIYIFIGGSGALHLLINDRFFRAFGTFGQPNPFGGFMGLLAPLAITTALGYGNLAWRAYRQNTSQTLTYTAAFAFYALAAGLIALGVIISWSRGAWLGFGVSMLMILFAMPRKWWQSIAVFVAVTALAGLLWTSGKLPSSIVDRINSATQEIFSFEDVRAVTVNPANYAVVERLAHWQAALNMARSHWWTGVGFGNYEVAYPHYQLISWDEPLGHAHNYYLNLLAEVGIIGLSGYLVLWGGIFWLTWQTRRHPDFLSRMIAIGLLGTWTYLSIHSLTDNLYVNNVFLHLGIMLGVIALLYSQTRQKSLMTTTTTNTYEDAQDNQIEEVVEVTRQVFRNPLDTPIQYIARRFGGNKAKEIERFIKFALVGISGAVIDIGLVFILQATILPPSGHLSVALVSGIAFCAAVISNFIWTRLWVYPDSRKKSLRRQLALFAFISTVGGVGRTIWVTLSHRAMGNFITPLLLPFIQLIRPNYIPGPVASEKLGTLASLMIAMVLVMMWNFLANRYWTYNDVE